MKLSYVIISLLSLFVMLGSLQADVIEKTYSIPAPEVQALSLAVDSSGIEEPFDRIEIQGLPSNGEPGSPVLPVLPVRLLLPQGHGVARIEVVSDEFKQMKGQYRLPPSQRAFPLSMADQKEPTPPNPEVYLSSQIFPAGVRSDHKILWSRGYRIVLINLHPVRYVPQALAVYHTPSMTVRIHTRPESAPKDVMPCRGLVNDRIWVEGKVGNPGLAGSYRPVRAASASFGKENRSGDPQKKGNKIQGSTKPDLLPVSGTHLPYIIITNAEFAADPGPDNFQALLSHRKARGMPGMIITVEQIYDTFSGLDDQEKIRNFCRFAYKEYDTEYILLGGDGHEVERIVPARGMWAEAEGYTEKNLKSDLYYGNLDGSFNSNGNALWGELDDGPDGGEVDLFAELYVGRASAQSAEELHHFVAKTIAYETDNFDEAWYTRAQFLGEFLWSNPNTWGGDYMDELIHGAGTCGYTTVGFPNDWTKSTLYEKNGGWSASKLISIMNSNNVHHIHHLGHANASMVMKLNPQHVQNLHNNRYFFAYSQGCMAGNFSTTKCMAEIFTTAEHGAFAVIMNDKYGWGEVGNTDGSSQYFHREFVDAIFNEGLVEAGRANADSKEDNLWSINYKANRWCCYETNLFGDPVTILAGPKLTSKGLLALDRMAYKNGGYVGVTVKDMDLNVDPSGIDSAQVTLHAQGGDAENMTLLETAKNSSIFEGAMAVSNGGAAPGNGGLELVHGETFSATYIDASDGFGGINVPVTAQAEADFVAPSVSNVHVAFADDVCVEVAWDTNEPVSGTLVYGLEGSLTESASNGQLLDPISVEAEGLLSCAAYDYYVIASDAAGNETVSDNGGSYYTFHTRQRFFPLLEDLNEDPGWSISSGSDWEWGVPLGANGDPSSGQTGFTIYGYNLAGPYKNNLGAKRLTTPPLDCSGLQGVTFDFWRLITLASRDNASVEVSNDGSTWVKIYDSPISPYLEPCWLHYSYDISSVADNEAAVYVRWNMGPTNTAGVQGGWNIDDVRISGVADPAIPWLAYQDHAVDDSIGGNGNGLIEPLESITMPLTLYNKGLSGSSVTATLKNYTTGVTVLDGEASFPAIPCNEPAGSLAPHFSFYVSESLEDGDDLVFAVEWTADGATGKFTLEEKVSSPKLICTNVQVVEVTGDGDGNLDPGETLTLVLDVKNIGSIMADNVSAELSSSHPQYITIIDPQAEYGDLPAGAEVTSQAPHFTISVDPAAPNYTWVDFTLSFTAINYQAEDQFEQEITDCILQQFWSMDTDPGWTCTGDWEYGEPQGKKPKQVGMGCPDPVAGYTGLNVLGYNLYGSYSYYMNAETLTSKPIDCSDLEAVKVRFKRWLGVASAKFDHAAFQVSTDLQNWITVWEHTAHQAISDGAWVHREYDLSAWADGESTVYLRWVMGPTSYYFFFCGWNLDDIEIWGR
ncbi:MAG: C25 family cysteine peptidase [Planctomycetota bacterium]